MNAVLTLTSFTPGEAERITGVSTAQQRDWRRRGFLPSNEGHARFDLFSMAEMWVLKLMADRGIGPQAVKEVAGTCATGIAWHALAWGDAYEGDHERTLEWQPSVFKVIVENLRRGKEAMAQYEADPKPENLIAALDASNGPSWGEQANWLRRKVLKDRGIPLAIPGKYFIWWADGREYWHESLDEAFKSMSSTDDRVAGPVVVLDLSGLASAMIHRAERALVHVEIEADTS
ncbi:hypothetical protein IAI58_15505 [Roseomonas marmotae]|uniref:MerR family transcriptional regulator n=1 Tax=Roseomonas marmotae TaxID=2768161 RepID=UPI001AD7492E|nr:MerR family transcriptional regulator [Roseomonas marmotae]QTI79020.1 hypothetical protein IAI58_15505 [Roseomonas marmotae]